MMTLCRLCGGKGGDFVIYPDSENSKFAAKVDYVLGIKILESDSRKTVCFTCKEKVEDFFDFKSLTLNSDTQVTGVSKDANFALVKIKREPDDCCSSLPGIPTTHFRPFGPSGTVMVPAYYTLDSSGNFIQVPAMMPVGAPIPLTSLPSSGFPLVVSSSPTSSTGYQGKEEKLNENAEKQGSNSNQEKEMEEVPGSKKKRALISVCNQEKEIEEVPENNNKRSQESNSNQEKKIEEVREKQKKKAQGFKSNQEKETKPDEKKAEYNKKRNAEADIKKVENWESPDCPNDLSDLINDISTENESSDVETDKVNVRVGGSPKRRVHYARRGKRRRGSGTLPSAKRRQRQRVEATSKPSGENNLAPVGRLTRSSTGAKARQKVIDSESDDGDFHPDDPDDLDDPTYTTLPHRSTSSSSSESDTEKNCRSGTAKQNERNTTINNDKSELISQILRSSRQDRENALKKSCPHCQLTYKHWVSYQEHVDACAKSIKNEGMKKDETKEETEEDKKLLKCIVCLKHFRGNKLLREHMQEHQVKKGPPFRCKECKKVFPDKGNLICHNALVHRSNVTNPILKPEHKKLHCLECDENFESSGDYICHQVLHHKKK